MRRFEPYRFRMGVLLIVLGLILLVGPAWDAWELIHATYEGEAMAQELNYTIKEINAVRFEKEMMRMCLLLGAVIGVYAAISCWGIIVGVLTCNGGRRDRLLVEYHERLEAAGLLDEEGRPKP